MAAKVFISYRREDSAGHAGRVHDRLVREFGSDLLFMDVDGIPLGVNFVKVLQEEVAKCSALLAVIGHEWLNVRDEDGRRRLDNPDDFVRVEIAAALQRDIPVIPIMLEGTKVPKANQLPKDLQGLALRNGLGVRHASFHADIDILIRGLKGRLTEANEKRVQSLTPGADKNIWMDDGAGDRDTTPNLRSAQETTRQSEVKGPLHQVANPAVSAEQRAVVTIAPALSKIPEEVTNFPDENDKSIPKAIAAEPSYPGRSSDGFQHIAPPADVRSRNMLFIIFAGIAIVVMGVASLMWPTTGPQDSTTTVKPATDTASAPQDSTTVKSTTDTASAPKISTKDLVKSTEDLVKSVTRSPSSSSGSLLNPDGHFVSPFKDSVGYVETQWDRDWKARGDALLAQSARIQSRLESRMKAIPPDWEKINEDRRAQSKITEEMSKWLDEGNRKVKEAIEHIK